MVNNNYLMRYIILDIDNIIINSKELLTKDFVTSKEIINYKKGCAKIYVQLINESSNSLIKELAKRGLEFKIKKIKNPIYRWIYYSFTAARDNITFQAPYLKGSSESDYSKQYIFWTKHKLEGIAYNLKSFSRPH